MDAAGLVPEASRGAARPQPWVPAGRRRRAALCGDAAAVTGVTAGVALGLMFAIEVPTDGPFVFGTTNDVLGGLYQLLIIPVLVEVGKELPEGTVRRVLQPLTVAAAAAGAASSALLVARVLPFPASTAVSMVAIGVQAGWMVAAGSQLLRRESFPRRTARLAQLIGVGFLGGGATVALGYALPAGSVGRWGLFIAGGLPGAATWIGWPLWYHLVARHLRSTGLRTA